MPPMPSSTQNLTAPQRSPIMRAIAEPSAANGRQVFSLNGGWHFYRCDDEAAPAAAAEADRGKAASDALAGEAWECVNLPHAARLEPLNASGGRNFQGICWYRRTLTADAAWAGRTIYLHLDGLMQVADVWLNDDLLTTHHGGYTPLTLELTGRLRLGQENELVIRLNNRDDPTVPPGKPQAELDFVYFAGISRDVTLSVVAPLHVSDPVHADRVAGGGVFVTSHDVSPKAATVRVQVDLRNAGSSVRSGTLEQQLLDLEGTPVAQTRTEFEAVGDEFTRVVQQLHVDHPRLWHPQSPSLYILRTSIFDSSADLVDQVETRIGIRQLRFDSNDGLFINGQKFTSFGANRHQDHPYVGYALSTAAQWRDVKSLRDAGFTSFRSHYPQAPAFMDGCDALGLLAIVSNPGWQFVGDELFQQRALRNARLMVRRDRNRPSVILWEAALNESDNRPLAAALHAAIHEEYPGDQCFTAGDRNAHFVGPDHGSQPEPSAWDIDYLHNDGTKPYWVREWGDQVDNWSDQQSANRVDRAWGEHPMLVQARAHLTRLNELWTEHVGTPTHDGRRLAGACLWAGIDCQRGYHHQPFYGAPLDALRLPKFDSYVFQSQRDPHLRVPGVESGPMVFIANFATFLSPTTVTVFSNCEQVRLIHGDHVVDIRSPDAGHRVPHPPFTFAIDRFQGEQSTMYMSASVHGASNAPVELRAEGLIGGEVVATHVVRPPGAPRQLRLELDLAGRPLEADGVDFIRLHARVCDAHGTTCPFAEDDVRFAIDGAGSLIGAPGANPFRARAGIASALVRATDTPGRVRVTASAFGLTPATIEFDSRPPRR